MHFINNITGSAPIAGKIVGKKIFDSLLLWSYSLKQP